MEKTEVVTFIILSSIILATFFVSIVLFVIQYKRKRQQYNKEKEATEKQHQFDLLNAQLHSQQQTMKHIGQEIHDSVAQKLTLASIYTQQIQFENKPDADAQALDNVSKIINDALIELRQLSKDLTDRKMLNADLGELIKEESEKVNGAGICLVKVVTEKLPSLDIPVKNSLLRIVQEFIQNSLKHAACKNISISVSMEGDSIKMKLEDDGKGFNTADVTGHTGIGLDNIRRRVQQLGGTHNLQSQTNSGTSLEITVPLQTDKQ